jgi:ABC-type multidrug transport system fused ATPase/permease subunit
MGKQKIDLGSFRKLWHLLMPEQRRAAIAMLGLLSIGMALETLGVGMVIPALALMTGSDLAVSYPSMKPMLDGISDQNREGLVVAGMLVVVAVYAIKAIFLALLAWRQAHYVYGLEANISERLFSGYLHQPYAFHLQRNSAQLIHSAIGQVGDISNVIQQGLILITEIFVMLGISILLFVVEPLGAAMVVSILSLAGWGFHRFTHSRILRWGEARQYHEALRIQHLQQGLGGVKDVKLLGRESEFLKQYQYHSIGSTNVGLRKATVLALPRLWMEVLAVIGLAALVLVMVWQGKPLDTLIPTLGLFAAAAFRIMPSVNRILGAMQTLTFSLPVINTLYQEFCLFGSIAASSRGQQITFNKGLVLNWVDYQYPSTVTPSLREICLTIPRGASVGFIGGSGAGKSTLVDIILGLLTPARGTVLVDGIDIQTNLRGWQDQIGYVPQSIYLTDDTLRRNVAFGLADNQISDEDVWRALSSAQLDHFVRELPQGLETLVGERGVRLSGGQRQRIGIARALYHNPIILVLDEATSSLDTDTERGVMEAVRALKGDKTLIIVAHRFSTVKDCDHLFRLERGMVVCEGSAEVML